MEYHRKIGDDIKTENGQTARITDINYSTNQITVNTSINWTQNEGISLNYNGAKPDAGAIEYNTGQPTSDNATYDLETDCSDGVDSNDGSCISGSCSHSGGGVVVDDSADGIYTIDFPSNFETAEQVYLIYEVSFDALASVAQPVLGPFERVSGREYSSGASTDGYIGVWLGYNNGDTSELHEHGYALLTSTVYRVYVGINSATKKLIIYLVNSSNTTLGDDITDEDILTARTWNRAGNTFSIGAWLQSAAASDTYFAHATITYAEVGIGALNKADFLSRFTGGQSSPTISSNCWLNSDRSACLTAHRMVRMPGEPVCHRFYGSENIYSQGGPAVFAQEVSASLTNSKTAIFHTGYGGAYIDLCYEAQVGDRFGFLNLLATDSLSDGNDTMVDIESNAFNRTVDINQDFKPWMNVDAKSPICGSSSGAEIKGSSSAQSIR